MEPHSGNSMDRDAVDEIDLKRYWSLLRSRFWLLILSAVLAAVVAFVVSQFFVTRIYKVSTLLLIDEAPPLGSGTDYNAQLASERKARTYAEMIIRQPVLAATIQQLELETTVEALEKRVTAEWASNTNLIEIQVEDTDPLRAPLIANTIATVFIDQIQSMQAERYAESEGSFLALLSETDRRIQETSTALANLGNDDSPEVQAERDRLEATLLQYRQSYTSLLESYEQARLANLRATTNVIHFEPAVQPQRPARPNVLLNSVVAAILSPTLFAVLIIAQEALDDTLRSSKDVEQVLSLPSLGQIARFEVNENRLPVVVRHPHSPPAEGFRHLRTNLQYLGLNRPLKTLLVSSAIPEEGKTAVVVNLGVVTAQLGRRVVIVEGDLRRPRVHKRLGLSNQVGLTDLFISPHPPLDKVLQETEVSNLFAITAGGLPPNPSEMLSSERMCQILAAVTEQAELVLIDSSPVTSVADAVAIAPHVDGVILVTTMGKTKLSATKQARDQLRQVGATVLGVVVLNTKVEGNRYSGHYYGGQEE